MQGNPAYRPVCLPANFTCPAVRVFVVYQKIGQKRVPEAAGKAVAFRQLDQLLQAAAVPSNRVVFVQIAVAVALNQPCQIEKYTVSGEIPV